MALAYAKNFAQMKAKQAEKRKKQAEQRAEPAYRAAQAEKERAAQERRIAKVKAQRADPEYQREQAEKRRAAQERSIEKKRQNALNPKADQPAKVAKPKPVRQVAKPSSKGMKGRTPTADERRVMDAIGALPCVCCYMRGRTNHEISLHHTDGRVKPDAHKKVLPLCAAHHDTPAEPEVRAKYPDLIPFHAKGSFGGPGAWRAEFGQPSEVLAYCYDLAGIAPQLLLPS